jgi:indole-3-glycerol phosphate synthase
VSILAEILAHKRAEVAAAKGARPIETLPGDRDWPVRSLRAALAAPTPDPVRVIAEIKRASPSAGAIRADASPTLIAREYAGGGASAISVLTDRRYFDGRLEFLAEVRGACDLPLLRKDFIIDPYQVAEARWAGADALLLIAAALPGDALGELLAATREAGLEALVEIHDEAEAGRAVAAGAAILGVNHRDLATFEIDLGLTERLRPALPDDVLLVAESGIRGPADVTRVAAAGAKAILVGEHLMRAASPRLALMDLLVPRRTLPTHEA